MFSLVVVVLAVAVVCRYIRVNFTIEFFGLVSKFETCCCSNDKSNYICYRGFVDLKTSSTVNDANNTSKAK